MKKIGICACYNTLNYGSMLQAYATQLSVERMGYKSEFILYKKQKNFLFVLKQIPRLLNKNLIADKMMQIKKKVKMCRYKEIVNNNKIRIDSFKRFQNQYYKKFSPVYYGYRSLCQGAKNYDSVLVGSDQLWTPGGLATNFYNLMFVPEEINKISYATSFGVSSIPWYQVRRTREYLDRINYLSVREVKGAEIIEEIAGREAKVVVDPTLLLTRSEWDEAIEKRDIVQEPYIFCYFLGENPEHRKIALQMQESMNLKIVCTPYLDNFAKCDMNFGDYQLFDIGPDDFVNLIRNAKYVLTDSFHGSVFSILYHKKFIVLDRYIEGKQSRNSRIDSLCGLLGLEERRCFNNIAKEIDYEKVDNRLSKLRNESMVFLESALKQK